MSYQLCKNYQDAQIVDYAFRMQLFPLSPLKSLMYKHNKTSCVLLMLHRAVWCSNGYVQGMMFAYNIPCFRPKWRVWSPQHYTAWSMVASILSPDIDHGQLVLGGGGGREWVWSCSHSNVRLQGAYPIESCLLSDIIYNADHVSLRGKVTSFSRNNSNIWTTVLRIQVVTDFVRHTRITKNILVVINKTTD